jgi:uncharacterized protein
MRAGVVGDIHGSYYLLRQSIRSMGRIDLLLFTGDGYRDITRLRDEINLRIEGVSGNCDFYSEYPDEQVLCLDKFRILLTHGHLYRVKNDLDELGAAGRSNSVSLVVFGHTHLPLSTDWYGIKLFNPGSLSRERACRGTTYGIIETTDSGLVLMHGKV